MPLSRIEYLFNCYVQHSISQIEEEELMGLLDQSKNEMEVQKLINKLLEDAGSEIPMPDQVAVTILQNILEKDRAKMISFKNKRAAFRGWMRVAAAAVLILFISGMAYLIFTKESGDKMVATISAPEKTSPILPGGNHAVLTMADGSTIVLDSTQNGNIQHGNLNIKKQNGLLVFEGASKKNTISAVTFNTLSTPRGGQYKVILPDGSEVWLNASSSLRFPSAFTGNKREVELTGEAYFEVTKDKTKPFHVKVGEMQIEVLGTHFNVNAYADEGATETSLLEGSVRIKRGDIWGMLKPGQQGVLENEGKKVEIKRVDMDEVIAWKNGLFEFNGVGIKTIMREISRWYDVDIVYSDKVPFRSFEGKISRDAQLSEVLKILELSNVKFRVEDRNIIVE